MPDPVAPEAQDFESADPLSGFEIPDDAPETPSPASAPDPELAAPATPEAETETTVSEPETPVEAAATPETEPESTAPATPKPVAPSAPAPDPAAEAELRAFRDWENSFQARIKKMEEKSLDPIQDADEINGILKDVAKGVLYSRSAVSALSAQVEDLQAERAAQGQWENFAQKHADIPVAKSREIWNEELGKIALDFPELVDDAKVSAKARATVQKMATKGLENRIAMIRAKAKEPAAPATTAKPAIPAKPKAPVTAGGARVTPNATVSKPPPPQPKTMDERWEQLAKDSGGNPDDLVAALMS